MVKKVMAAGVVISLVAVAALAKDEKKPLQTVSSVDLKKYAGQWYEIARLPNNFEKDCVGDVTANYTLREDGKVTVLNKCKEDDGKIKDSKGTAKVADKATNSKLKVTFFWPFDGDYQIIGLGPNYEYALVGAPDRKYLWVLSRTPRMDEGVYKQLLDKAAAQGFDVSKMVKTPQAG